MSRNLPKKQQGFLLPLAIFIVVVMGVFALTISRNTIQTSTSVTLEAVSIQAFYAAESGAQRGMQTLFYPDANVRQQVDTRCIGLNVTHAFNVPGLRACSAVVTCTCTFQDSTTCGPINAANYAASAGVNRLTSFYTIASVATCGAANLRSTRTIEAGSFLRQE